MRPLRGTRVRAPFLPSPLLSANTDPLRSVLVVGALAPALLLGGNATWVGQAARPEDTAWPARPAVVRTIPPPIPGASAIIVGFPHQEPPTPDRAPAPQVDLGQQPIPGAMYAPIGYPHQEIAARGPAPMLLTAQPPIPGAVALLLRAPRDEAAPPPEARVWPALIGRPPQPPLQRGEGGGGRAQLLGWPHAEPAERGGPSQIDVGQQPIPGAAYTPLGWARQEPTERGVTPLVRSGAQPLPAAAALLLRAPRDEVVAPASDRFAPTWIGRGADILPNGHSLVLGWPRIEPAERGAPLRISTGWAPVPGAAFVLLAPPHPAPLERLPIGIWLARGQQPVPDAASRLTRAGLEPPTIRVPGPAFVQGPPTPLVPAVAYLAGHPFDGTITIFGRVRVAWGSVRPGAALAGRTPGTTITSTRPAVTIEDE